MTRRAIRVGAGIVLALVATLGFACRTPSPSSSSSPQPSPSPISVEPPQNGLPFDARPLPERIPDPEQVRRIEAAALRLLPVEAWAARPVLRQRVWIEWGGRSESFEAVLQRRPGELALIGLGPMNLVGFRIALLAAEAAKAEAVRGESEAVAATSPAGEERIVFANHSGRALPFTPAHMLADVQRVFYPWLDAEGEGACRACEREGERNGLVVAERRGAAALEERRFEIAGLREAGQVRVRYADWRGAPAIPFRVELENGWFGYRLTIETLEVLATDAPASGRSGARVASITPFLR